MVPLSIDNESDYKIEAVAPRKCSRGGVNVCNVHGAAYIWGYYVHVSVHISWVQGKGRSGALSVMLGGQGVV